MPCCVRPWGRYPLPSRLELQLFGVTGRSVMAERMYRCVRWVLVLPLAVGWGLPGWAVDCQQLQEQRDQLARRAMAAEVALVHAERQRLCPQLEALATADPKATDASAALPAQLDYGAYIRCRERAEAQLLKSRPVLYRNTSGFPFLTSDGARQAREADSLIRELQTSCSAPSPAKEQAPQPSQPGR
jgi:hypothetical protein